MRRSPIVAGFFGSLPDFAAKCCEQAPADCAERLLFDQKAVASFLANHVVRNALFTIKLSGILARGR